MELRGKEGRGHCEGRKGPKKERRMKNVSRRDQIARIVVISPGPFRYSCSLYQNTVRLASNIPGRDVMVVCANETGTQSDYAYYCIDGVCLIPPGAAAGKVCQPSEGDAPPPSKVSNPVKQDQPQPQPHAVGNRLNALEDIDEAIRTIGGGRRTPTCPLKTAPALFCADVRLIMTLSLFPLGRG